MNWFQDWKRIISLTVPNVAAFSSSTLMNSINLIMIGSLGSAAIAAVGIVNILMYNLFAFFRGTGASVNYLVAQNYGAGTLQKGIERTYQALYIISIVAVAVIGLAFFVPVPYLQLMGGSQTVVQAGVDYLLLRLLSFCFILVTDVLNGFINGIHDTKRTMYIGVLTNTLNVLLNYVLIYGKYGLPKLGVAGLGFAFLIANFTAALATAYYFFIVLHKKYHTRQKIRVMFHEMRFILKESVKIGLQELGMSGSMLVFTYFVSKLGTDSLAANEIALTILALAFLPGLGFGATATILVGHEIGKGDFKRAKRIGQEVAILGFIFMGMFGILFYVFAIPIAGFYTNNPVVLVIAAKLIQLASFFQVVDSGQMVYTGGLRGAGDTSFLLWWSLILGWLFFIPFTYLLTDFMQLKLFGAWLSMYIYILLLFVVTSIRYFRLNWFDIHPV